MVKQCGVSEVSVHIDGHMIMSVVVIVVYQLEMHVPTYVLIYITFHKSSPNLGTTEWHVSSNTPNTLHWTRVLFYFIALNLELN